jgi:aldehyde dehydrogenase (NAD+)
MTAGTAGRHDRGLLLIDGDWRASDRCFDRYNPARPAERVGTSAAASSTDVADAYAAAERAQASWAETSAIERGAILTRAAGLISDEADAIASTLVREEGKAIRDARAEVHRAAAVLAFHGAQGSQPVGEVYDSSADATLVQTVREPLGVVAVITPWNFPIAIPAWKIAPALIYGNTVVFKPAEIASGTATWLADALLRAGLPAGVLNLVTGHGREIGDALVSDPRVSGITFTGSNAVGRRIASLAAQQGAKIQLELGGKNPSVVLGDADLDRAATCIVRSAMLATGQRCTATSRVIADRRVADELVDRLVALASALNVGDPGDETTDVGPLSSAAQHRTVTDYIDRASAFGHDLLCGGLASDPDDGYFVTPTIYAGGDRRSPLVTEEIFGPVVVMTTADGPEEAVALANDTPYGLSASVFTSGLRNAMWAVRALEAGVVHVNGESTGAEPHVPFGGVKASSSGGREQGQAAREFFTETKTIYLEHLGLER